MKFTGQRRKYATLKGRMMPKGVRKIFGLDEYEVMDIVAVDYNIILCRFRDATEGLGDEDDFTVYIGRFLCDKCREGIKALCTKRYKNRKLEKASTQINVHD